MAVFGHINEFKPDQESLAVYLERVELFFAANNVQAERKVPMLLAVIGSAAYSVLHNLLAPESPKMKTYEELVAALRQHYEPKPLVIGERFHFYRREQRVGESVADYVAELRRLATTCAFGHHLNEALHDRIVCGIKNESTQKRLLADPDLTLAKATDVAQAMEAADKGATGLKSEAAAMVDRVSLGQIRTTHDDGTLLSLWLENSFPPHLPCTLFRLS